MGAAIDVRSLVKVAVFCVTFSIISTAMVTLYIGGSSDYDYDAIGAYKSQLVDFSGGSLVNDTPWVLTGVYTPFVPGTVPESEIANHIEYDKGRGGWLYGEKITNYPDLGKATDIHMDKNQKSNQLLTVGDPVDWQQRTGKSWWNGGNDYGIVVADAEWVKNIVRWSIFGEIAPVVDDENYGYEVSSGTANNWNYSGYRYCLDPVLPFKDNETSSKDGRLSLVWYQTDADTGISGALEIYGFDGSEQILLAKISAADIINTFQSSMGYVQTLDFDFSGTHLNLTIRFSPTVYSQYASLMEAWNDGAWSFAISSASAGNFFDVEESNAFSATTGNMLQTFIDIYTFQTPEFESNPAVNTIIWLIVSLPMTIALLCVAMSLVGGVFKFF